MYALDFCTKCSKLEGVSALQPLAVSETAALLRVSVACIYALVQQDILPVARLGRTVRVDLQALNEFHRRPWEATAGRLEATSTGGDSVTTESITRELGGRVGLGEAALWYLQLGWKVFPCYAVASGGCTCGDPGCKSPGKHPPITNGVLSASANVTWHNGGGDVVRTRARS